VKRVEVVHESWPSPQTYGAQAGGAYGGMLWISIVHEESLVEQALDRNEAHRVPYSTSTPSKCLLLEVVGRHHRTPKPKAKTKTSTSSGNWRRSLVQGMLWRALPVT